MEWSLIWLNAPGTPCDGSPANCAHLHHDWRQVCRHCHQHCRTIADWRQEYAIEAEYALAYIFFANKPPVPIRNRLRILGPRTPDLVFSGTLLFEVFCENQPKFTELLRAALAAGALPRTDMTPGACFRRTLSDVLPESFQIMAGEDPCLMVVLDPAQRPDFDKADCAKLARSRKWERCQLELNSAFEPDEEIVEARAIKEHSPWSVCEL